MCTGIPVFAGNKLIFARTMEFTAEMNSNLYVVPKGTHFPGTYTEPVRQGNKVVAGETFKSKSWDALYTFIGPNFLGTNQVIEGFNEKGLHVAGFYFPGYEFDYQAIPEKGDAVRFEKEMAETISQLSFATYILSRCACIDDMRTELEKFRVCPAFFPALGKVPGVHWIVQEADGKSVVVEYLSGKCRIMENPYGVITNSPDFNWHLTNVSNYINLTSKNSDPYIPRKANGSEARNFQVGPLGQGSGMLGLPGDFTSPSRFIRAMALSQSVDMVKTNKEGVNLAWNLINNVDIAIGTIQFSDSEVEEGVEGISVDYTQWVSVSDLGSLSYYYRTYNNQNICVISLADILSKMEDAEGQDPSRKRVHPVMVVPMSNEQATYYNATLDLTPVD